MMVLPSIDGFVTQLQETGTSIATVTGSDDLAVSIPTLVNLASSAGICIRVFLLDKNTLHVEARP